LPILRTLPLLIGCALAASANAAVFSVPAQFPTIQAAINAAASGDVIEVAPGVYPQALTVSGKTLEIRSRFATSGDPADIEATVLEVSSGDVVTTLAAADLLLRGLSLRNGSAAVRVNVGTRVEFVDGRVRDTSDGISLEGGSQAADPIARAVIRRSILEGSSDDAVDSDGKSELWIEDSEIRNNGDDGIEIRLHNNSFAAGESIAHVIQRNRFTGNGEDGVQLIDYDALTPRSFRIERNVFASNVMAGLGLMCNGNTIESFEGCPMPEAVRLVNNSFVGNDHGLSGGSDLVGVNNLFAGNGTLGAKNVAGASLLAQNLFHANGTDHAGSNVDAASTLLADPLLNTLLLQDGSPAIDAGVAFFQHGSEVVLNLPASEYGGAAPDLGALEWIPGTGAEPLQLDLRVSAGSDDAEQGVSAVALAGNDLELVTDGSVVQTVGIRFGSVALPVDALLLGAWIQFRADETGSDAASLLVQGQAADNPGTFTTAAGNVSTRPRTLASVSWTPPPWTFVSGAGPAERTPDLSALLHEIVDRPGWVSGNAMAFIFTGSGRRTAESYEGLAAGAPLLHVEYVLPGCGNGILEPSEACDDGNFAPGDGCDGSCQVTQACSDGVDNDVDAHFDFPLDPGCDDGSDDSERSPALACDNGGDEDGDGGIDFAGDDDGDGISDPPGDLGCAGPASPSEAPACQDGIDNDGHSDIDFDGGASLNGGISIDVADPHCDLPSDSDEAAPFVFVPGGGCGLGPELVVALGLLWCGRSARRSD
jgi:cysteine-rich repeat protein